MKKVLIVDDSTFVRKSLKKILEKNGYAVAGEAENGLESIYKYNELQPDIVMMDIIMPMMNGLDALEKIHDNNKQCKVMMLSAYGQERFIKQALFCGAVDYLQKPFVEADVIDKLQKMNG